VTKQTKTQHLRIYCVFTCAVQQRLLNTNFFFATKAVHNWCWWKLLLVLLLNLHFIGHRNVQE